MFLCSIFMFPVVSIIKCNLFFVWWVHFRIHEACSSNRATRIPRSITIMLSGQNYNYAVIIIIHSKSLMIFHHWKCCTVLDLSLCRGWVFFKQSLLQTTQKTTAQFSLKSVVHLVSNVCNILYLTKGLAIFISFWMMIHTRLSNSRLN